MMPDKENDKEILDKLHDKEEKDLSILNKKNLTKREMDELFCDV